MQARLPRTFLRLAVVLLVALTVGQFWVAFAADRGRLPSKPKLRRPPVSLSPIPAETVTTEQPHSKPKPKVVARAPKKPAVHRTVTRNQPSVFSGLGVWVDQFDFANLVVDKTVATMRANVARRTRRCQPVIPSVSVVHRNAAKV